MPHEVETKVLDVDQQAIAQTLNSLGATQVLKSRLVVDWYRTKGSTEGSEPWFLRVRSYSDGKVEVTWKGASEKLGAARKHREINFWVSSASEVASLFTELNLEPYAHQEKDRTSWTYEQWRFDLDCYPGMPPYLEIEGTSEAHIQKGIELLDLKGHPCSAEGERILIQEQYGLDWYSMKF